MKIAFLCPTVSRTGGGIFEIERKLACGLAKLPGTSLEVYGPSDEHAAADLPFWRPLEPQHFSYAGPESFRFSPGLRRAFLANEADLSHLHALWMYNSIILNEWSKRNSRPYIITTNGMLDRWAVRNSGWKKKIAFVLYEQACLKRAACLQVNSEAEYKSVRSFGLRNPVCIIPNGVDVPPPNTRTTNKDRDEYDWSRQLPAGKKILLYLGRIHPKKGLANLITAWAQANQSQTEPKQWALAIAGWDQAGHQAELQKLVGRLGLASSVSFVGPQFGDNRDGLYQRCDGYILPSFSEGLPMTVLESWSHQKPVVMTGECNIPQGFSAGAAIQIEPTVDSIAAGLIRLCAMSDHERQAMGQSGLHLVKSEFCWNRIATQMRSVYAWILGSGSRPPCVVD